MSKEKIMGFIIAILFINIGIIKADYTDDFYKGLKATNPYSEVIKIDSYHYEIYYLMTKEYYYNWLNSIGVEEKIDYTTNGEIHKQKTEWGGILVDYYMLPSNYFEEYYPTTEYHNKIIDYEIETAFHFNKILSIKGNGYTLKDSCRSYASNTKLCLSIPNAINFTNYEKNSRVLIPIYFPDSFMKLFGYSDIQLIYKSNGVISFEIYFCNLDYMTFYIMKKL